MTPRSTAEPGEAMFVSCKNGVGSGWTYGGGRTLIVPENSTTNMRPSGRNSMFVGRFKPVARTSLRNEFELTTFTGTAADSVELPLASRARAVTVCAPFGTVRVSHARA